MGRSRLFWKLFSVYVGLNLTLALGFLLFISSRQAQQTLDQIKHRLRDQAVLLESQVGPRLSRGGAVDFQPLFKRLAARTQTRLTLVDINGNVLADSHRDPATLENHRDRPELIDAAAAGVGVARRISSTLGVPMYYVAVPVRQGGETIALVRVALPVQEIDNKIQANRTRLWTLAGSVAVLASGLTYLTTRRIVQPLYQLIRAARAVGQAHVPVRVPAHSRDEIGVLGTAFNRMQDELARRVRQSEEYGQRLETVLRSMIEGVIVVDADERVLLANAASERLLGFGTSNFAGRPLRDATRNREVLQAVSGALKSNSVEETEFELPGPHRRIVALRAIRLPGTPHPGAVAVLRDMTELRALERMRSEFVANVSHELKTPLAAIKAYAETLRLGAIHDEEHNVDFVNRIEQHTDRLHQLILDLLALARVEAGRETLEIADLVLTDVVESCIAEFQEAAAAKNIALGMKPPENVVRVRGEEEALRTILTNLIDNAIKYTDDDGSVSIRWWSEDRAAVLEVSDTGIGIAPEDQARVFERFYRVDKARSRELGGTGLGLAIVKHLTQALGGSVHISSTLGEGTAFQVRLPSA